MKKAELSPWNTAFFMLAENGVMGLVAVREPQAVLLTTGTYCTGLKTEGVPLSRLDHSN